MNEALQAKLKKLFDWFDVRDCAVAFSGGVDSATLAKALVLATARAPFLKNYPQSNDATSTAIRKLPPTGFFAVSATSTEEEKSSVATLANEIGIQLQTLESQELKNEDFVKNSPRRCYWCKKIRFAALQNFAEKTLQKTR